MVNERGFPLPDIIWLNGSSSSGKTTLSKALQLQMDEIYLHVQFDSFIDMLPMNIQKNRKKLETRLSFIASPFHQSIRNLVQSGNKLIVDHVFEDRKWLYECLDMTSSMSVLFAGLYCSSEVLRAREIERGDRALGLAKRHLESVHTGIIYDVCLDTAVNSPDECVVEIQRFLSESKPSAFDSLRKSLSTV